MFTGIIQGKAPISKLEWEGPLLRYALALSPEPCQGLQQGASLSVDGICQTVVDIEEGNIWFEAIEETLSRTTLKDIYPGKIVNYERAAKIGDEIGGHLLSGHIYGVATISRIDHNSFTFKCPPEGMKFLFVKGFVAIDGISLTVVAVNRVSGELTLHLIPETLKRTTLGQKGVGSLVNIEFDAMTQAAVETVENLFQKNNRPYNL